MFDIGQKIMVLTEKGIAYDATILARAQDDEGRGAYKVAMHGLGPEQLGQWHKATEVFLPEKVVDEEHSYLESFLRK